MKKKWTIATVLLLAVALLAVGTWAYFSAVGTADNVITMGSVKLALHDEDGNGNPFTTVRVMPGSVVNKVVYVENVGTGAFYTRVKITPEILNADSERMPLDPSEHLLVLDLNDTDWIAGADGYYYYNGAVDPKTATTQLFSRVTTSGRIGPTAGDDCVSSTVPAVSAISAAASPTTPAPMNRHRLRSRAAQRTSERMRFFIVSSSFLRASGSGRSACSRCSPRPLRRASIHL